jgi:pSer/pThr/pTyr-binding forkhead associated (FHA) protein
LSREHCSIDAVGDKLVFCDMGSKGGSKINKVRVTDRTVLRAGDLIKVGKTTILVLNK